MLMIGMGADHVGKVPVTELCTDLRDSSELESKSSGFGIRYPWASCPE